MTGPKIRVAISGGGVAGASLIHALLQYPHIDAHIFEAAPKFKEAGVAFGMTRNAQTALDLMGSRECLERAGGVQMQRIHFSVCQGKDIGVPVYEHDVKVLGKPITSIVQRANFLHEFLASIPDPEERMHASKKLLRFDRHQDGSLTLHFEDATTHDCDILIGADGIRSVVRKAILGPDDPAVTPRNTGWWALMSLQPYEQARASLGPLVDNADACEIAYLGDGQMYMHNILSHGSVVQFSMVSKDDSAKDSDWQRTVTAAEVEKTFVHPDRPANLNKGVLELLCTQPEHQAYYLFEHPAARTYVDGPVAVTGDAAHATTAWQASGGGASMEDSMILSTLLGRAKSPKEAVVALKVFDQVRRPRCQRIVESSYRTGVIATGRSEAGIDAEKMKELLGPRWDFILDFDVVKHRDEAVELFEAEVKKS